MGQMTDAELRAQYGQYVETQQFSVDYWGYREIPLVWQSCLPGVD